MKEKLLLYLFLTVGLMSMKAGDTTSVSITGYVKDEAGRGIKGVVVNNGINFTTTDRKGAWTLPTDTLACRFISISTPSGYALPAANGLAHGFYKDVRAAMSDEQNVFVLHRREKPATRFHYIAISDPQVRTHDDMKRWTTETMRDIMHSADSLRRTGEVVAVTLGDLVFDNMTFLSKFATTMLNDRMTVFQCIGNHDFNKAYAGAANMQPGATRYAEQNFCRQFGPLNYSFNIGKAHVVTINNISYRGSHKYEETIMPADMEWLKKDLSYVPDSALILINMHAPAWNTNEKQDNITNAEELKEVLAGRNVHVFCGHTHFYENVEVTERLYQHNIGAACGAWWTSNMNRCGAPNGYMIADISGTAIKWSYKATNRPTDYQMRLYKPGEFRTQSKYVVANIWDWDPHCRVAWYQDGKYMGRMEQTSDDDEMFMRTKPLPAQMCKTGHLFRAKPNGRYKTIKVVFTNRFGRKYSQTIVNEGRRPAITDYDIKQKKPVNAGTRPYKKY